MKPDILNPMWRYFRAVDTDVKRTFDRLAPGWNRKPETKKVSQLKPHIRGKT